MALEAPAMMAAVYTFREDAQALTTTTAGNFTFACN
jgi:hypothetical protein